MVNLIARLGAITADFCDFGRAGIMLASSIDRKPEFRGQWPLLTKQLYSAWCSVATDRLWFLTFYWHGSWVLQGYLVLTTFSKVVFPGYDGGTLFVTRVSPVVTQHYYLLDAQAQH